MSTVVLELLWYKKHSNQVSRTKGYKNFQHERKYLSHVCFRVLLKNGLNSLRKLEIQNDYANSKMQF